jgi:3'-5' exoribonuclease
MINYLANKRITDFFAVRKSNIFKARNGNDYLDLKLYDGAQEIPAKQWDYTGPLPQENTVIQVTAAVGSYQGQVQFTIQEWSVPQSGECDPGRFLPVCPRSQSSLLDEFIELTEMVKDEYYAWILKEFMSDGVFAQFIVAPGAKNIHHAYLYGLLEHSVDVTKKALVMAGNQVDKELLITGALLHDIGKIHENDWSGCAISKTSIGWLLGHITLGLMIIDRLNQKLFNLPEKHTLLYHLIASHHGKLEWGSPIEPQTKEAIILHAADMLDFQYSVIDKAMEEVSASNEWTGKVAGIGREFYVGKPAQETEKATEPVIEWRSIW